MKLKKWKHWKRWEQIHLAELGNSEAAAICLEGLLIFYLHSVRSNAAPTNGVISISLPKYHTQQCAENLLRFTFQKLFFTPHVRTKDRVWKWKSLGFWDKMVLKLSLGRLFYSLFKTLYYNNKMHCIFEDRSSSFASNIFTELSRTVWFLLAPWDFLEM